MIIYDETSYEEDELHAEDIEGYVLCTHCTNCPLHHENEIYTDGMFFCEGRKEWKLGNDILEFMCSKYKQRDCRLCKLVKTCIDAFSCNFCDRYTPVKNKHINKRFLGRRKLTQNEDILDAEDRYNELREKRLNHKFSSEIKTGNDKAGQKEPRRMGLVSIPNPFEKNKVYLPFKKEDSELL